MSGSRRAPRSPPGALLPPLPLLLGATSRRLLLLLLLIGGDWQKREVLFSLFFTRADVGRGLGMRGRKIIIYLAVRGVKRVLVPM